MTEVPQPAEQVRPKLSIPELAVNLADKIDAWSAERPTKADVVGAATTMAVVGVMASELMRHQGNIISKGKEVFQFADAVAAQLATGFSAGQTAPEFVEQAFTNATQATSAVETAVLGNLMEEGIKHYGVNPTISAKDIFTPVNIKEIAQNGVAFLMGGLVTMGIEKARRREKDWKPLVRSTHIGPLIAKGLRTIGNLSK